jgi:hypothetical protein
MKHRPVSRRLTRTLVVATACTAVALVLAGIASASPGPNYGNFNPLTGRPNDAPRAVVRISPEGQVGITQAPAASTVRTVVERHGGQTLAISLAGAAFLVTLAGTGYMLVRVSRMARAERAS